MVLMGEALLYSWSCKQSSHFLVDFFQFTLLLLQWMNVLEDCAIFTGTVAMMRERGLGLNYYPDSMDGGHVGTFDFGCGEMGQD